MTFNGCRQSSGPCQYRILPVQAKIVSLEPYREGSDTTQLYHIVLRFNESNLAKKDQLLEEWVPRLKGNTNSDFLIKNNIKTGNIYPATVSELESGNCQPVYVSFDYYFKPGEKR
jgi:hypothetical protein